MWSRILSSATAAIRSGHWRCVGGACLLLLSHKRQRPLLKVVAHHVKPATNIDQRRDGAPEASAPVPPIELDCPGTVGEQTSDFAESANLGRASGYRKGSSSHRR